MVEWKYPLDAPVIKAKRPAMLLSAIFASKEAGQEEI